MPIVSSSRPVRPSAVLFLFTLWAAACGEPASLPTRGGADPAEVARWEATAARVTITRDRWGIPHVRGQSDADAVFGALYAQAEDDFHRIEVNYLNAMGRLAEAEGESAVWSDLRMKLFIHPDSMRQQYAASPDSLKRLLDAFADGLNYYLHTHPAVTPRVLTRFEPWMALTFSEGSIGGDIESINLRELRQFYDGRNPVSAVGARPIALAGPVDRVLEPAGSNGFAIAPSRSASGHALLLINPHTSFFFRAELQMTSDEGLNAYGASTWGQFFIYQGFNERAGWMHTSSGADAIDEYVETVTERGDTITYRYDGAERPVQRERIVVPFRWGDSMVTREFTVYRTHHGPVVRAQEDGRWITVRLMQEPVKALTQSYWRTKARTLAAFRATMDLHTNSSNNTIYADADGTIAYFHANFVPRRDPRFDWRRPVDGSTSATEWQGLHTVDESPLFINPATGWLQNTNNWPYSAIGAASPPPSAFPRYMDYNGENPRGVHAVRVLQDRRGFTLDSLIAAAYDPELTAFETLLPPLFRDHDALPAGDARKARLAEPIATLRGWDRRYSLTSVPTSLAIYWGETLWRAVSRAAAEAGVDPYVYMAERAAPAERLEALASAVDTLTAHFGRWDTPWGEINRFQRLTGDIVQPFADSAPSVPVPFASSRWGSLAAFGAATFNGTKRLYGTRGNSFVAVVEFGPQVRAKAVMAGGQSGDPASPHFNDQAAMYARGEFREVLFWPEALAAATERQYVPGKR
jgi:acyl-homoserine-lactone acylase